MSTPDPLTAEHIERLATAAGLSIPTLCRLAGVSKGAFYRWRSGKRVPSVETYRKLRDAAMEAK